MSIETRASALQETEEPWEIFWTFAQWRYIHDRFEQGPSCSNPSALHRRLGLYPSTSFLCRLNEKLPAWAYLKMVDDSRPLEDQACCHASPALRCTLLPMHDMTLVLQVQNASVFIPTTGTITARTIRAAPKLKLIVQPATGHNNIDTATAASLGIPVCTSPGAEHKISLAFITGTCPDSTLQHARPRHAVLPCMNAGMPHDRCCDNMSMHNMHGSQSVPDSAACMHAR